MKIKIYFVVLALFSTAGVFAQNVIPEDTEIRGSLKVEEGISSIGSFSIPINNAGFGTPSLLGVFYNKGLDNNSLRTRIGINYSMNTANNITPYVINGALKAPLIEMDAQAGSISIFGENGSGSNFRNPSETLNLGLFVASDGKVGVGTTEVQSNFHVSGGNGDSELLIEADKDNVDEMDNPFITLSQDKGFVKGFIGLVGNNNTAAHINKYRRFVEETPGNWVQRADYPGTLSNYMLLGMNNGEGVQLGAQGEVRMTVHKNGNVGIRTNNPSSELQLDGKMPNTFSATDVDPSSTLIVNDNDGGIESVSSDDQGSWGGFLSLASISTNGLVNKWGLIRKTSNAGDGSLVFSFGNHQFVSQNPEMMRITASGNVGIGTGTPTQKLEVNGTIRSKEIICEATPWPDYVFEENYELKSLTEIEDFIKEEGHLPNIPSAQEVKENGLTLGKMNALLLEKIEELTLHLIRLEKEKTLEIDVLKAMIEQLKSSSNN